MKEKINQENKSENKTKVSIKGFLNKLLLNDKMFINLEKKISGRKVVIKIPFNSKDPDSVRKAIETLNKYDSMGS